MSERANLLLHRLARAFPAAKAFVEVNQVLEAEFFEDFEGAHAASTSLAVDEGGLGFVELGELGLEVARHDIDVLRAFDVTVFELVGGAHIDDGDFAFGDDFGGFVGFNVFGWVSGECEGGNEEKEGEEEAFFLGSSDPRALLFGWGGDGCTL